MKRRPAWKMVLDFICEVLKKKKNPPIVSSTRQQPQIQLQAHKYSYNQSFEYISNLLMTQRGPKFNQTNVYRVRRTSRLNEGLFLSKLVLKKHGSVQIQGMGECICLAFKFGQILSKNGLATIKSIREENHEREGRKEINPKITILLQKSANFDNLTKDIVLKSN